MIEMYLIKNAIKRPLVALTENYNNKAFNCLGLGSIQICVFYQLFRIRSKWAEIVKFSLIYSDCQLLCSFR